jgi:hypothetical protein
MAIVSKAKLFAAVAELAIATNHKKDAYKLVQDNTFLKV